MTFVLGLTGSIGMGKSATAGMFRAFGVPVHDADAAVHALYRGPAVPAIENAFPGTVVGGVVDRARLGREVIGRDAAMARLEAIVHPLVKAQERAFLVAAQAARIPLAVLDVPLLFEAGGEGRCDAVAVVLAPPAIQRERVLARPGMTPERFEAIRARQMPDADKRRRAHFIVDTGQGFSFAQAQVRAILACLAARPGRVMTRAGLSGGGM